MLIFESDLLNALDFLFIISGAPIESIEDRLFKNQQFERARSLAVLKKERDHRNGFFLLEGEDRFMEILFLKMSFLDQIVHRVLPNLETFQHPELGCSLDRIWVHLADACNMIPRSWSFKVRLVQDDPDKDAAKPSSFPKSPPGYGYYFLGLIWLFTLAVNRRQGSMTVYSAAEKLVTQADSDGEFEKIPQGNAFGEVFSSENIFWKPEGKGALGAGRDLWEKAIQMGLSLFREGLHPSEAVSDEKFIQDLNLLRRRIRKSLFEKSPLSESKPVISQEDRAIRNILMSMRDRLSGIAEESPAPEGSSEEEAAADEPEMAETVMVHRDSLETSHEAKEGGGESTEATEAEMAETVMLRRQSAKNGEGVEEEAEKTEGTVADDDFPETVVLGRDGKGLGNSATIAPQDTPVEDEAVENEDEEDDMMETVAISPKNAKQTKNETEPEDELAETVMLHRGDSREHQAGPTPFRSTSSTENRSDAPAAPLESEWDDVPETIIISRNKGGSKEGNTRSEDLKPSSKANQKPASDALEEDDDDIMSETVILRPGEFENEE